MNIKDDLQQRWWNLEAKLVERFGKKPDIEAILFLIGMQETNFINTKITKEQKQDMMHVAVCTLLAQSGYYEIDKLDEDGWPHFEYNRSMPKLTPENQEILLKKMIIEYFKAL